MPVILPGEKECLWLDPSVEDNETLLGLLKPYPAEEMEVIHFTVRKPGKVFGWSALVEPYRYTATAQCSGDTKVIKISRDLVGQVIREHPEEGLMILKHLKRRSVSSSTVSKEHSRRVRRLPSWASAHSPLHREKPERVETPRRAKRSR
jgi:CRP-like cAMP-binding protein